MRLIDADAFIEKLAPVPMVQEAIRSAIDTIPTVEVDDGWIPCEVTLPKESGLYLVTREDIIDDYAVDIRFFNRTEKFVGWSGCEWHEDPIAWMELPKPYIPEESE